MKLLKLALSVLFILFVSSVNSYAADPCQNGNKLTLAVSVAANSQLITGTTNGRIYICSIMINVSDAENVSLVSGTGTICATSLTAVIGGSTAATGNNLLAGSGYSVGDGTSFIGKATAVADNLCLLMSGSGRIAGVITYVIA